MNPFLDSPQRGRSNSGFVSLSQLKNSLINFVWIALKTLEIRFFTGVARYRFVSFGGGLTRFPVNYLVYGNSYADRG